MKEVNKTQIPFSLSEDFTKENSVWKNGKYVMCKGVVNDTYYIGHESEEVEEEQPDGAKLTKTVCRAFAIEVRKGATKADIINTAEMIAYGLKDAMEVASFNASLSRKYRENSKDEECKEHDEFIGWVKEELNEIL